MTKHYHAGFDYFTPKPGTATSLNCMACNQVMDVERDVEVNIGNSFIGPSGKTRQADKFTCPHSGSEWHDQVIALRKLQNDTPSSKIAQLLEEEIDEIILKRSPTKEHYNNF